jgi:cation diffusion facilitator family transporter
MQSTTTPHDSPIAVYGAIAANTGIAVAKFVAATLTGSSALMSEGFHSVVDTGNQVLLLIGINRSRRPVDDQHQFGHGKEIYFWSLIVAIVLFGIGGGLAFWEGLEHVIHPTPVENPIVNYVVLGIAFALEAGSWTIAYREISREGGQNRLWRAIVSSKDPSVVTVLLEDSAALLGLVAAFVGVLLTHVTGDARFDGIASIAIGAILTVVAFFLAFESRGLLVGERASDEVIAMLTHVAESDEAVKKVELIRTMHLGPREVLITARVRFASMSARELAAAIVRLKRQLADTDPRLADVTIEPTVVDPGAKV